MWPKTPGGRIRIVFWHTPALTDMALSSLKLRRSWGNSSADTSHATLKRNGARDYASNGWGLHRRDWS